MGNPVGSKVAERGKEVMAIIVAEVSDAISKYREGGDSVVAQ